MTHRRPAIALIPALLLAIAASSCSSAPEAAQKGTPAFYWQAAKETYTAGDLLKTNDHLLQLTKSANEFTDRARPWQLTLSAGLAKGFMELAESYELGSRANKANPTPFRKQMSDFRTAANGLTLNFAEQFQLFTKSAAEGDIPIDFPYPAGSSAQVPALGKAGAGMLLTPPDLEDARKRTLVRGVLLALSRAVGAAGETAKAQEMFRAGAFKVPRATFLLAMANALSEQSELYSNTKLDQPDKLKYFCNAALDTLKLVPEGKDRKDLTTKIQAAMKKAKVT